MWRTSVKQMLPHAGGTWSGLPHCKTHCAAQKGTKEKEATTKAHVQVTNYMTAQLTDAFVPYMHGQ
jgi:hypothetical protein